MPDQTKTMKIGPKNQVFIRYFHIAKKLLDSFLSVFLKLVLHCRYTTAEIAKV